MFDKSSRIPDSCLKKPLICRQSQKFASFNPIDPDNCPAREAVTVLELGCRQILIARHFIILPRFGQVNR
jgi:hypothetical protein